MSDPNEQPIGDVAAASSNCYDAIKDRLRTLFLGVAVFDFDIGPLFDTDTSVEMFGMTLCDLLRCIDEKQPLCGTVGEVFMLSWLRKHHLDAGRTGPIDEHQYEAFQQWIKRMVFDVSVLMSIVNNVGDFTVEFDEDGEPQVVQLSP